MPAIRNGGIAESQGVMPLGPIYLKLDTARLSTQQPANGGRGVIFRTSTFANWKK